MSSMDKRPVLLTAAQPTAALHLGNYLGAVRHWVRMAPSHEAYVFICDWHALTAHPKPAHLRAHALESAALYQACGLDPDTCALFLQSHVSGHTELAWVLACLCPLGDLQRMTQFKDKAAKRSDGFVGSGLLYYPVLQAADILLYQADVVPVGEDQKQHLELTRDMAQRFNHHYSETFALPASHIPATGGRIMSLQAPENKMSKSDPHTQGTLFLLDPPALLRKKIKSAVTDSDNRILAHPDKPGITNLLTILAALSNMTLEATQAQFADATSYGPFKERVADAVVQALEPIQARYQQLIQDKDALHATLARGAALAQRRAERTLRKVFRKVGLVPPCAE